jgi:AcrR family transcriptional regulator
MPPRSRPSLVNNPVQTRSRATHEAIVRAFRQQLATTPFDQINMADLARRADVSVGGLYARFSGKDALLLIVADEILDEARAAIDEALQQVEARDGSLADLCEAYVRTTVGEFRRHRRALQQVQRGARGDGAAALAERVRELNEFVHERFRTLAWARRGEIRRRGQRAAIEIGLFIASAAAREAILAENWATYDVTPDDATLIREITASLVSYLTT